MILSGKIVADRILEETRVIASGLSVRPCLGVVLVGDNPASRIYVGIKRRRAEELGIDVQLRELHGDASDEDVISAVETFNADPEVHGVLVQMPLPEGHDTDRIVAAIDPGKDVDGFHPKTIARFLAGNRDAIPVFPRSIIALAQSAGVPLVGKRGVVIANSRFFGDVVRRALADEGVEAEIVRSSEIDAYEEKIASADIVVTAIGRPERFPRDFFREGAIVIDGGISERDGGVFGDIAKDGDDSRIFLSPVPGGVGPVTVACLLRRVAGLAKREESSE